MLGRTRSIWLAFAVFGAFVVFGAYIVLGAYAVAAMNVAPSPRFVDGKSVLTIGGVAIPNVHDVSVMMQQGRALVDADWSEAQLIERKGLFGFGGKNLAVVMYRSSGAPVRLTLVGCKSEPLPIHVPIDVPPGAGMPPGSSRIELRRTPPPRPPRVTLHCRRIAAR